VIYSQNRKENQRMKKKMEAREQKGSKDKMEAPI
jgi:hypothetical protein